MLKILREIFQKPVPEEPTPPATLREHESLPGVEWTLLPDGADRTVYGSTFVAYQGTKDQRVVWTPPSVFRDDPPVEAGPYAGDEDFNAYTIATGRITGHPRCPVSLKWWQKTRPPVASPTA